MVDGFEGGVHVLHVLDFRKEHFFSATPHKRQAEGEAAGVTKKITWNLHTTEDFLLLR